MYERARYPHLLPQDAPILTEYLKQHGHLYSTVLFDHRVGEGRDPGPEFEAVYRQMGIDLSQRRIDALGITATEHHIIEVTDAAGVTALGQLLAYQTLLQQQLQTPARPVLILAARTMQSDMAAAYNAAGVHVFLYPDA
jgi:hypothetical protein